MTTVYLSQANQASFKSQKIHKNKLYARVVFFTQTFSNCNHFQITSGFYTTAPDAIRTSLHMAKRHSGTECGHYRRYVSLNRDFMTIPSNLPQSTPHMVHNTLRSRQHQAAMLIYPGQNTTNGYSVNIETDRLMQP